MASTANKTSILSDFESYPILDMNHVRKETLEKISENHKSQILLENPKTEKQQRFTHAIDSQEFLAHSINPFSCEAETYELNKDLFEAILKNIKSEASQVNLRANELTLTAPNEQDSLNYNPLLRELEENSYPNEMVLQLSNNVESSAWPVALLHEVDAVHSDHHLDLNYSYRHLDF